MWCDDYIIHHQALFKVFQAELKFHFFSFSLSHCAAGEVPHHNFHAAQRGRLSACQLWSMGSTSLMHPSLQEPGEGRCRCAALQKSWLKHILDHTWPCKHICKVISSTNTHLHRHLHTCMPKYTHTHARTHSKLGKAGRHLWAHEAAVQLVCGVSALAWCISIHEAIMLTLEAAVALMCVSVSVCVHVCDLFSPWHTHTHACRKT